jgi:hypothetical protein
MMKRSVIVEGKVTWPTSRGIQMRVLEKIVCNRHVEEEGRKSRNRGWWGTAMYPTKTD